MYLVKLDATDSTNGYLKNLVLSQTLEDFTVVMATEQHQGRGQMGNFWLSETGMNLTVSILKKNSDFFVSDQFLLNIRTSLAIYEVLKSIGIPDLHIKWPNDILSGNSKICGILIENMLAGNKITTSIIGFGLNVNQLSFEKLANVSSLKLILGKTFNLEELLQQIVSQLEMNFSKDTLVDRKQLWNSYEDNLFRKDKASTFQLPNGELFTGIIRHISPGGKLVIELENEIRKAFDLKEIKLLY